jgi:glucokinase
VKAAQAGDPRGLEAVRILGERVGIGVANAINVFDPELVVIGGGVSAAGELLLAPARETARRFVLPGVGRRTEIRLARYGPRAGVRGAALMAAAELRRHSGQIPETSEAI